MKKQIILNKLLDILTKQLKIKVEFGENYEKDRQLFRGICNQLPPMNLSEKFYILQDKLLSIERDEKEILDVSSFEYDSSITIWQGDITTLKADVIVNAANDEYLGCFVPCHNCIDNIIMSASGFQMRNELMKLKENKGFASEKVKVTKGYNLPSNYVFHVAGPKVFGDVSEKNKRDLRDCYYSCLNKAKEMKLSNIVFCCISTGLYSFPNELASDIAFNTVKKWLEESRYNIKIVFNVFKDIDRRLYERKLRGEN